MFRVARDFTRAVRFEQDAGFSPEVEIHYGW